MTDAISDMGASPLPPAGEPSVPRTSPEFARLVTARRSSGGTPAPETGTAPDERLLKTCRDLESMLWQQVIGSMRKSYQEKGGLFESGTDSEIWQGMMDEQWAHALTGRTDGLAEAMARQLSARARARAQSEVPSQEIPSPEVTR